MYLILEVIKAEQFEADNKNNSLSSLKSSWLSNIEVLS